MAFESVNVSSLKNAITACKNSVNSNNLQQLIYDLSNNNVWSTDARDNLRTALDIFIDWRYRDLTNQLNTFDSIVLMIEDYKELEEENRILRQQYLNLKQSLYYNESYTEEIYDMGGKKRIETRNRTCKNFGVERDMYATMSRIEANERKMEEIKNKVSSAI